MAVPNQALGLGFYEPYLKIKILLFWDLPGKPRGPVAPGGPGGPSGPGRPAAKLYSLTAVLRDTICVEGNQKSR